MFKKSIIFGDIHFGKKGNSDIFNKDCLDFINWMCEKRKELNAETCIFLGDWHNDRKYMQVKTLKESIKAIETLSENFEIVIMILGNHDLYYRDKREIHSLEFAKEYKNICIIEEPVVIEDCSFFPWITMKEKGFLKKFKSEYAFGHFEIEKFLMNNLISCDSEHAFVFDDFKNYRYIFSGHFHKRQKHKNIFYVGSPFPHDFSDLDDQERGFCFLEKGKEPLFFNWSKQPKYIQVNLSDLIDNPRDIEKKINSKTYAKILVDVDITFEETLKLREFLMNELKCRETRFIPKEIEINESTDENEKMEFRSIDELVIESLKLIESPSVNKEFLIDIYKNLDKNQ